MTAASPLLPVAQALVRVLASAHQPLSAENVALAEARGRTLASDLAALRTQPPFNASAMDGYALRVADIASLPATKTIGMMKAIDHSAAERPEGSSTVATLKPPRT